MGEPTHTCFLCFFMPSEGYLEEFSITFDSVLYYFMEKELDGRLTRRMGIDTLVIEFVT